MPMNRSGRPVAFSVMVNNQSGGTQQLRQAIDSILSTLYDM